MHDIEEKAYLFEKNATLEQIREVALRMKCGKLDLEMVKKFKTKEQLMKYLKERDCPALRHLEAKLYCSH